MPDATINQIGIFTAISYIAIIIFEVPSGYFADLFGHKKTLILSKLLQGISVLSYVGGYFLASPYNFYIFIIASVFQTVGYALFLGTKSAFYHDLLESQGKEKEFSKYEGKLEANTSLASVIIIFLLPFLTLIHIVLPFLVWAIIDFVGLLLISSIPSPIIEHKLEEEKNIFQLFFEAKMNGLLSISIFLGLTMGFFLGENSFRTPYLENLGYPIALIGAIMAISRIVWFLVGHNIYKIEKYLTMKTYFLTDIFLFSFFYLGVAYFNNPYFVGLIISIFVGYKWGRASLVRGYLFKEYIKNKKYKATFLSMSSMLNSVFGTIVAVAMGYLISFYEYKISYTILGFSLFTLLSISYYFAFIKKKI